MSDKKIVRHYKNEDIDVKWEPAKCIHSGICVQELPKVFRPKDRPWVHLEEATTPEIEKTVNDCPSRALTYTLLEHNQNKNTMNQPKETEVKVMKNGPLVVDHGFTMVNEDGSKEEVKKPTALCRCGASENKPYCDGAHVKIGFKG